MKFEESNIISEVDEKNNSIHKQLCINCGVHIDSLSTYSQTATGNQGPVYIYGQFGHKRASKRVVLIDKDSKKKYIQ